LDRIIVRLHDGSADKVEYFVRWYSLVVILASSAFPAFVGSVVIIGILSLQFPPTLQGQPIGAIRADFIGAIVCSSSLCVLGLIGILLALRVLRRLRTIRFALNDYDRFLKTRNPAVGSS
jgi:hypothetical protein